MIKEFIQVIETDSYEYINELIDQYPDKPKTPAEMKEWVHSNTIYKYFIVYVGERVGSIWITKFDMGGKTYYNLEGYRDKRANAQNAFLVYKQSSILVLDNLKVRPILMNHWKDERYAKLLARSLGFKYWYTDKNGLRIYEYQY